jgi:hypothetical protein
MTGDRAYALRFISGKYQRGQYPLCDAGELVIGCAPPGRVVNFRRFA